jgi:CHAT domain-containing protein/Tfp pilus assembly protein PilF
MTLPRGRAAGLILLLIALAYAASLPAQEAQWDDLNAQVQALYQEGKFAEALPIASKALQRAEAAFGPGNTKVATALNNLAALYSGQGSYDQALPLLRRALEIDEKALGPKHPSVATDLSNLAELYDDLGLYTNAEPLLQRALEIDEKALGPKHHDVACVLGSLALLYDHEGRYEEALPLSQRALRIDEKTLRADDPGVATDLDNLAGLYMDQGRYAEAEPLFRRALGIDEKALGPDHPEVATDLNNLAELYEYQGRYAEAEPLFQRALRIDEKAFGSENPDVSRDLNNLAALYDEQGRYAEAEPLLKRALRIEEKEFGPDHPSVATELSNLASLYDDEGKNGETEPLFQRALRIDEKALGPDHPGVASDLNNLATLADERGLYNPAEALYQRALDNLFQQFQTNFSYMTEKERLGFLDTVADDFLLYFSFVHRYRNSDPSLTGNMYNLLLWEKGFVVGSIAEMRRAVEASGDKEALRLLGQLTARRTQIAALLNVNPPDRELWRKQVDQLRTEADEIEKALVARSSAFAEKRNLDRATWQQIRDALQPGEAAVEFARFRYYDKKWTDTSYYVALVVTQDTNDQPEYIFLGEDRKIEGDALIGFRQQVLARGLSAEPETELPDAAAYRVIWRPLEAALAGKKRIYLSPDGGLNQVPFGIIAAPDGKLLMEKYDLRVLFSTKEILRVAPPRTTAAAILVGDPDFDLSEARQRAAIAKLALQRQPAPVQSKDVSPKAFSPQLINRDQSAGRALSRIPGTGEEVNAIAALMKEHGWKADVYTGDLALKRVVEQAGSPRVVHLATHGFFLPDRPIKTDRNGLGQSQFSELEDPMLRSGLYFAGAGRTLAGMPTSEDLDNGVLTAMEAANLNLRGTELVVLSACNTGKGDVKNGEGVFGLRRALQEAGAQAVLMSLWSVPDQETQELMKEFYSKWLSGMDIHEALKEAQLEMREQVKLNHDGRDLPYYWGAFVLVGR